MDESSQARISMLSMSIKDRTALYAAYMPFLKNGGLFIPTERDFQMGETVYVSLSLLESPVKIPLAGEVVWVTPPGAQGGRAQGIGLHFDDSDTSREVRDKIERMLGNAIKSTRPTHTL